MFDLLSMFIGQTQVRATSGATSHGVPQQKIEGFQQNNGYTAPTLFPIKKKKTLPRLWAEFGNLLRF
jgi:hypothetical protein